MTVLLGEGRASRVRRHTHEASVLDMAVSKH